MNWRGEAVEKLRKYDAMCRSLQNIPLEVKRLEADARAIRGARTDGTPVKGGGSGREEITELTCHIDDMTPEALAFAGERLMAEGALDVAAAPIVMKKGRAAWALTVLCRPADEERLALAVLRETSTLGVRSRQCRRYLLAPSAGRVETPYGPIATKRGEGFGIRREKPEYSDAAQAARRCGVPFQTVWEAAVRAMEQEGHPQG